LMKMEVSVAAPEGGVVARIDCAEGSPVVAGQRLMVLLTGAAAGAGEQSGESGQVWRLHANK
jgi:urea carboxylase